MIDLSNFVKFKVQTTYYTLYLFWHERLCIERSCVEVEIKLKTPGGSCHLNMTKEYVASKNMILRKTFSLLNKIT